MSSWVVHVYYSFGQLGFSPLYPINRLGAWVKSRVVGIQEILMDKKMDDKLMYILTWINKINPSVYSQIIKGKVLLNQLIKIY